MILLSDEISLTPSNLQAIENGMANYGVDEVYLTYHEEDDEQGRFLSCLDTEENSVLFSIDTETNATFYNYRDYIASLEDDSYDGARKEFYGRNNY